MLINIENEATFNSVVVERGDVCPHSLTIVLIHSKITCSV